MLRPEIQAMEQRLAAAKSLQELDALYVEWVGYSIVEDDPEASAERVREILDDYISEVCFAASPVVGQEAAS